MMKGIYILLTSVAIFCAFTTQAQYYFMQELDTSAGYNDARETPGGDFITLFAGSGMRLMDKSGTEKWTVFFADFSPRRVFPNGTGYVLIGNVDSVNNGDVAFVTTDLSGNVQTVKTYGSGDQESYRSAIQTSGGDYVLCLRNFTAVYTAIMKINAAGDTLWAKQFDGVYFSDVVETGNGDLVGVSYGSGKIYCVKLNSAGDVLWSKYIRSAASNYIYGAGLTVKDDQIWITGAEAPPMATDNMLICKLDTSGGLHWAKAYEGGNSLSGHEILVEEGTGNLMINSSFNDQIYLHKLDSTGSLIWTKVHGDAPEGASHFRPTSNGGYYLSGVRWSWSSMKNIPFFIKTDPNGDTDCSRIDTNITETTTSMVITDTTINEISAAITIGTSAVSSSSATVGDSVYCLSVDSVLLSGKSLPVYARDLSIYPNPLHGKRLKLSVQMDENQILTLKVFNTIGKECFSKTLALDKGHQQKDVLLSGSIPSGMYFVQLTGKDYYAIKKLVIR